MSRARLWILLVCCAVATVGAVATPATHPALRRVAYALGILHQTPPLRPGMRFPRLALAQLNGTPVTLHDGDRSGTIVYNVFTSWCPSCRIEAPLFAQAARQGVRIVGIDQGEDPDAVERFATAYGIPYPIMLDNGSETATALSARVIPETIVVSNGVVRSIAVGPIDEAFFQHEVLGE